MVQGGSWWENPVTSLGSVKREHSVVFCKAAPPLLFYWQENKARREQATLSDWSSCWGIYPSFLLLYSPSGASRTFISLVCEYPVLFLEVHLPVKTQSMWLSRWQDAQGRSPPVLFLSLLCDPCVVSCPAVGLGALRSSFWGHVINSNAFSSLKEDRYLGSIHCNLPMWIESMNEWLNGIFLRDLWRTRVVEMRHW